MNPRMFGERNSLQVALAAAGKIAIKVSLETTLVSLAKMFTCWPVGKVSRVKLHHKKIFFSIQIFMAVKKQFLLSHNKMPNCLFTKH